MTPEQYEVLEHFFFVFWKNFRLKLKPKCLMYISVEKIGFSYTYIVTTVVLAGRLNTPKP